MTTMTLETSNIYADEKVSSKDLYLDAPTSKEFKKRCLSTRNYFAPYMVKSLVY